MRPGPAFRRALTLLIFWFLASPSAQAQASGSQFDESATPQRTDTRAHGARQPIKIHVSGILTSQYGRSALINGRITRSGDRVGDAEILSIDDRAVSLLSGNREIAVLVGSTTILERNPGQMAGVDRVHGRHSAALERNAGPASSSTPVGNAETLGPLERQITVEHGQTLSGIAQRHRGDETTINQMMIALYQANPQAFGGNINDLRAGAVLRIPDQGSLPLQTPDAATAEVARHTDAWQPPALERKQHANLLIRDTYGPVESGETVSEIASIVSPDGISMNQMMIALFEANPRAFGGNVNILHEGAMLQIPTGDELTRYSHMQATAEVLAQTDKWRAGPLLAQVPVVETQLTSISHAKIYPAIQQTH